MAHEATKLVLGRGEVYFDRFISGTHVGEGERYLGNTSKFIVERDIERLDRATSYGGKRVAAKGTIVSESHTIDFTTDHVDIENLSMWFGGESAAPTVPSDVVVETFTVKRGRFYQLGKTVAPFGTPNIASPYVYVNDVASVSTNNYVLNFATGRIEILPNAVGISDGDLMRVEFQVRSADAMQVTSQATEVLGSLRFVAFNQGPTGRATPQTDMFFPMVRVSARGQTDMKSDEWQQWVFEATALNLKPGVEQVYVMKRSTETGATYNEQVIIDEMGSLELFPFWEDILHVATNEEWPVAVDFQGV